MEAVTCNLDVQCLNINQAQAIIELTFMMGNMEMRFYKAFDMELDDERTIYKKCARSLVPRYDEPGLCLLQDWNNVISA
jgi:hypothetical protein